MKFRALRKSDITQVNKWLEGQTMTPRRLQDFPSRSYIVPGVAVACIRDCEGGYGMMDSVATNPLVSGKTRHLALTTLWNHILQLPDFKVVIGFTKDEGTLERALRHGFKVVNQSILVHSQEA